MSRGSQIPDASVIISQRSPLHLLRLTLVGLVIANLAFAPGCGTSQPTANGDSSRDAPTQDSALSGEAPTETSAGATPIHAAAQLETADGWQYSIKVDGTYQIASITTYIADSPPGKAQIQYEYSFDVSGSIDGATEGRNPPELGFLVRYLWTYPDVGVTPGDADPANANGPCSFGTSEARCNLNQDFGADFYHADVKTSGTGISAIRDEGELNAIVPAAQDATAQSPTVHVIVFADGGGAGWQQIGGWCQAFIEPDGSVTMVPPEVGASDRGQCKFT